jgi:ABC-type transport system involved in multi-copper enzyme maturation permease subunit
MISVALNTFRELYRERIFYNVLLLTFFLMIIGYVGASLVYGHQDRVMIHFGTTIISLSLLTLGIAIGGRLLRNEIEQRWIYLPLSRPISRWVYWVQRLGGTLVFLAANLILMLVVLAFGVELAGGTNHLVLLEWAWLTWMEASWILCVSAFLSLFLRPGLNALVMVAFVFISHSQDAIRQIQEQEPSVWLGALSFLAPNGSLFLLDTRVYYDYPLTMHEFWFRSGYGMLLIAFSMALGVFAFNRKNL